MTWRRIMHRLFPRWGHSEAERKIDGVLAEQIQAGEALSNATADATAEAEKNTHEAECITAQAQDRILQQERRRAVREKAVRERGIVPVVDDLLQLQSFGGSGDRKG